MWYVLYYDERQKLPSTFINFSKLVDLYFYITFHTYCKYGKLFT